MGDFMVGHSAGKWLSWDGNPVYLTTDLEALPFMGDLLTPGDPNGTLSLEKMSKPGDNWFQSADEAN